MQTNPGNPEYPLGTVMFYGPDNRLATKLVAGVFLRPGTDPAHLDRWITHAGDVRNDVGIADEVATFLKKHGVKKTVTMDRIIGCAHEEGVDYPDGGNCPHCPFWYTVDRFSHEPVVPADTLSPEELMIALAGPLDDPPMDVLLAVEAKREAVTPLLLQAVESVLGPLIARTERQETLFAHAIYFLAKWREARACPLFIRWIASSETDAEYMFDRLDEIKMQDGARLLAAVGGGDLGLIKGLVENQSVDDLNRSLGVLALALLVAWGEIDRQTVVDYFAELATVKLEREPNFVWGELANAMKDIEAWELEPHVRKAFADGLVDPMQIDLPWIEEFKELAPGVNLEKTRLQYPPITDVLEGTALWEIYGFDEAAEPFFDDPEFSNPLPPSYERDVWLPPQPYVAPPKIGRNDPCPCGSGKKYKKCCGG